MSRKILSPGNVKAILKMRAILDDWGEPRYTGYDIAVELGVSESTVWRVIKEQAAYKRKVLPSQAEELQSFDNALAAVAAADTSALDVAAQVSLAKLQEQLQQPATRVVPELLRSPPPSPLDGGDAPVETTGSGLAAVQEKAVLFGATNAGEKK